MHFPFVFFLKDSFVYFKGEAIEGERQREMSLLATVHPLSGSEGRAGPGRLQVEQPMPSDMLLSQAHWSGSRTSTVPSSSYRTGPQCHPLTSRPTHLLENPGGRNEDLGTWRICMESSSA